VRSSRSPRTVHADREYSNLCKNELYMIEHEALPRDNDESVKLKGKRERRRACTCDQESGSLIAELEDR
jgi:hypothetical protein